MNIVANDHIIFNSTQKLLVFLFCLQMVASGCNRDHLPTTSTGGHDYMQVNLVADTSGYDAKQIDHNLSNPLGMAVSGKGSIWVCCNRSGQCLTFDANGQELYSPVSTPYGGNRNGASPNGIVFNKTSDFAAGYWPTYCICSGEEGILTAWVGGDSTITVADRSGYGCVYKGITIASSSSGNFIYVADFYNDRIEVFDKNFSPITGKRFSDPSIPSGFAPFNIINIDGKLFVTYAKQRAPSFKDDEPGIGNGYVNIFDADGNFLKRFASQGTLNSPWGLAQAPADFGQIPNAILVSNYGDGRITVFDSTGKYQGLIETDGSPVNIEGLWDITFVQNNNDRLYFTSGPAKKAHGVFGYLQVK